MDETKIVERPSGSPVSRANTISSELITQLLALSDGTALEYQLAPSIHFPNWHSNLRNALIKRGHLLHYRLDRESGRVTLWVTKLEGK